MGKIMFGCFYLSKISIHGMAEGVVSLSVGSPLTALDVTSYIATLGPS